MKVFPQLVQQGRILPFVLYHPDSQNIQLAIEEIKTICVKCSNKAIINAKFYYSEYNQKIILRDGDGAVELGAEERYQPMCWSCWQEK